MPNIAENFERRTPPYRPERPKNHTENLKRLLENISEKTNREIEQKYGLYGFLNADCTISMEGYADSWGGIYQEKEIEKHKGDVKNMDLEFSSARNENVQAHYGVRTPEEVVQCWKKNKEKSKSGQMEMAITALLCKILKDDFLVVRTATHDDYFQGADNIILNKRTGEAICAFDAFHEGGQGELTKKKEFKTKKIIQKDGAEINYGMKLKDGKLARSKMKNVPIFSLGLNSKELADLLDNMSFDPEAPATPVEYEIFSKLKISLSQQRERLIASSKTSSEVQKNLVAFKTSLAMFERIGATIH